jgi:hypothetical protein
MVSASGQSVMWIACHQWFLVSKQGSHHNLNLQQPLFLQIRCAHQLSVQALYQHLQFDHEGVHQSDTKHLWLGMLKIQMQIAWHLMNLESLTALWLAQPTSKRQWTFKISAWMKGTACSQLSKLHWA